MKNTFYWIFIFGIATVLFSSCNSRNTNNENEHSADENAAAEKPHEYYDKVFQPDTNYVFRNVNFLQSKKEVAQLEEDNGGLKLLDDAKSYLFYEVDLSSDTSRSIDYAEVKYFFDVNDALDIISVNYYIADSSDISAVNLSLNKSFTKRFGNSYIDSQNYMVWESSFNKDGIATLYEVAMKKLIQINDPGITVEYLKY